MTRTRQRFFLATFIFLSLAASLTATRAAAPPLPTSTPEAQGVESQAIVNFVNAFEKEVDAPHGVVILRHGNVIAKGWWAPYQAHRNHILYSLSKSFTSTAIGMLYDDGKLDIDAPVLSFFPDEAPENPSDNLKAMRVRDLLSMNSGHDKDTLGRVTLADERNWVKTFLSLPVEHQPGTFFRYNTGATYMCSAIVQKITGKSVLEFLTPRLFEPLGIEHPTWETDPRGINTGGWGLSITTEDIARFGQLYLQRGVWNGKRLISDAWVTLASAPQTPNGSNPESDWNQGYGFQFWRCRHNAFRGDGAFGQFCVVMPDLDMVVAINAGQGDMQKTLNLLYDNVLPGVHDAPLPANDAAARAMTDRLASLAHPTVEGDATSPTAATVNGKTYKLDDNNADVRSVTFTYEGTTRRVTLHTKHGDQPYDLGSGAWVTQTIDYHKLGIPAAATTAPQAVAASGAWTKPNELTARCWLIETPFRLEMTFTFSDDAKTLTMTTRLHPLNGKPTTIKGAVED
ncbi:MAG: serine hydrolase [Phycisphaera sp.]|nr:serine hydrolase [Phycisphaera sp.]